MTKQEAYSILELKENEPFDVIKKAYKKLALKYHPDRNPGSKEAEEKFKQINNAYIFLTEYIEINTDTQKKKPYKNNKKTSENNTKYAYHKNYHERYKNGEFGEDW